ncbi:MAG: type II restriction endonuclease [Candidatus Nitrosocaldaceae archaeon]|nr:MAG: type II restriction endonuclease [Candidatus Nitrosocaldaceae archaeon]
MITKGLDKYDKKNVKINGREYTLRLIPELIDEDLNIYEGFIFIENADSSEVSYFKSRYKPLSGYTARLGFIVYDNSMFIKDFRRDKHIIKNLNRINQTFLNKLKKVLDKPNEDNFNKLFDRSDIIEEFYILYRKARDYLLNNIKGIIDTEKKEEFVDNLMMQMMILWYLQERGFFNNDKNYFVNKFKELKQKRFDIKDYYGFLRYLFEKISSNEGNMYHQDKIVGKVIVIGPAIFLNGGFDDNITIPDRCFYKDNITDILINTPPKKVSVDVPLLNLFESREWTEGNVDDYVLGAIYEKLITAFERKKLGAYYTPEEITSYIAKNTIEPYLIDRVNEHFNKDFKSIDELINNADKDILFYLFKQLRDIKILDPAVGSAHFLASAIDVLVDIYSKIIDKARELEIKEGFKIVSSDDKGNIKQIELLDIKDEEQFNLYVKFFIILARNIYGVDINPSAIKIAKARLFITLAKHFNASKAFVRFPNVHFNLRVGNSLIGYTKLGEKKTTLLEFIKNDLDEVKDYTAKIPLNHSLRRYMENISRELGIEGIIDDIKRINQILADDKVDWNEFKEVLFIKDKLIKILIASLNSIYAKPINDLLNKINELFISKLDRKFAEEYNLLLELKKVKTFHWVFEFPEVMLDKGGFDVVIGNPPYVRQEEINHIVDEIDYKDILSRFYKPFDNTFDYSMFFILRSLQITKSGGYHSFIITNKWLRAGYGKKIREFLKENFTIKKVIDFNGIKVFVGATVDTMVYVIQKDKPIKNEILYNHPSDLTKIEEGAYYVKQESLNNEGWSFVNKDLEEIKEWIKRVGKPLKELDVKIYRGITTGFNEAFIIDDETRQKLIEEEPKSTELIKPILRGNDIGRYYVSWKKLYLIYLPWHFPLHNNLLKGASQKAEEEFRKQYPIIYDYLTRYKKELENRNISETGIRYEWYSLQRYAADYYKEFEKPKIVWQEISKTSEYYWDALGIFYLSNTAYLMSNSSKDLLLILNSRLIEFVFSFISQFLSNGFRHTKQYIEKIPICLSYKPACYNIIADYLSFSNSREEQRQKLQKIINFFDQQIADSLVYELYFKEKFYQDGLYKEPKEYLLELISKHLKPIDYDNWVKLYWKKQLEGLSRDEEKELESLERENLSIINEVFEKIQNDREILKQIEKIRSHKWVKIIENM